jgi:Mce-associated membrane protein
MGTSTRGKRTLRPVEPEPEEVVEESVEEPAEDEVTNDTDDGPEDEPEDDEPADEDDAPGRRRWPRPAVVAVVLAVLLVAGGAVWAWLKIQDLQDKAAAPEAARQAAVGFAKDLGTYDYRDMDGNFRLVAERSTANFAGQLKQITQAMNPLLTQTQATSKGAVPGAGVVTVTDDRAVVVVFLDQTIKNSNTAQPRVDRSRMQVTLVKEDGVWKLDHLEAR